VFARGDVGTKFSTGGTGAAVTVVGLAVEEVTGIGVTGAKVAADDGGWLDISVGMTDSRRLRSQVMSGVGNSKSAIFAVR